MRPAEYRLGRLRGQLRPRRWRDPGGEDPGGGGGESAFELLSAEVLQDGRHLRLVHRMRDWPDAIGLPRAAGGVSLDGASGAAECLGASARYHDLPALSYTKASGAGILPAGGYSLAYALRDAATGELVGVGQQTRDGGSGGDAGPLEVSEGQFFRVRFWDPVPEGCTGEIYALEDPEEGSLVVRDQPRLLLTGIPPGAREAQLAESPAFLDIDLEPISSGDAAYEEGWPDTPELPRFLTWESVWLLDESDRVEWGDAVTLSVADGALTDEEGHAVGASSGVEPENYSVVGPDGFRHADLDAHDGGATIYVSSTHGDDDNDGLTPTAPIQTLQRVTQTLDGSHSVTSQVGKAYRVRLLRGDTWATGALTLRRGGSPQRPAILDSYWDDSFGADPGTRPRIGAAPAALHVSANSVVVDGLSVGQVVGSSDVRNVTLIDCEASDPTGSVASLISISNNTATGNSPIGLNALIRCDILDAYDPEPGGRAQGVFLQGHVTTLFSECLIDRCGWIVAPGRNSNVYSHNVYGSSGPAIYSGCWLTRGGSHGVQMRGGGFLHGTWLDRNAIAVVFFGPGAIRRTVASGSRDIYSFVKDVSSLSASGTTATCVTSVEHTLSPGDWVHIEGADQDDYNGPFTVASTPDATTFTYELAAEPAASPATGTIYAATNLASRGFAFDLSFGDKYAGHKVIGGILEDCLVLPHRSRGDGIGAYVNGPDWDGAQLEWGGAKRALIRNVTLRRGGGHVRINTGSFYYPTESLTFTRLLIDEDPLYQIVSPNYPVAGYSSDGNALLSGAEAAGGSLASWKSNTGGSEANSIEVTPEYADPTPTVGLWGAENGLDGSDAAFYAAIRQRDPGAWSTLRDARAASAWAIAQSAPSNLPSPGDGPRDYYGAHDYRE